MSTISLSSSAASSVDVDALVIGVAQNPDGTPLAVSTTDVDTAFGGRLNAALAATGVTGKAGEVTRLPGLGVIRADTLVAVGLGRRTRSAGPVGGTPRTSEAPDASRDTETRDTETWDAETLRRAAGAAARALAGTRRVGLALPVTDPALLGAVGEGALLGAYAFLRYRRASATDHKPPVREFVLLTAGLDSAHQDAGTDTDTERVLSRVRAVTDAMYLCRDLVNTPPCDLRPEEFAEAAVAATEDLPLTAEVLDAAALRTAGYGGILGVGQGSVNPPRLVRLAYTHPEASRHLALVGKGITFDSGGLSLKPAHSMEWMKSDMGGAAAVIAAMTAIARLGLLVNVTGWVPMAENMPSGTASRPSDVLTIYGGKTVEVLNTDAEGRLILADVLARASEDSPDLLVDAATLTGAQLVALGSRTSAVMSNDEELRHRISDAAARAGEALWPMPMPEELRKSLDSEIADIANVGDKYGGMLVAAIFLSEFVGKGIRWAHLDIAGPAFERGDAHGYTPRGGTGAAVRTLVQVAQDLADGRI